MHAQCSGCRAPISGSSISALGGTWHAKCFVCVHCTTQINFASFHMDPDKGGAAVCDACYQTKVLPQCMKCRRPIKGPSYMFKGSNIHGTCFRCAVCDIEIQTAYIEVDGGVACGSVCARKAKAGVVK